MKKSAIHIAFCFLFSFAFCSAQEKSLEKGDLIIHGSIGAPHLLKNIIKGATGTDAFKKYFSGTIGVSNIKGLNPVCFGADFGFNKFFSLGLCAAFWNVSLDVTDKYNVLHAGQVTGTDETDVYKFKISSSSFGIRPDLHIPIGSRKHDVFFGLGLGFTQNKISVDFSSTDVNKVFPNLNYDFKIPGSVYFAPTLGYRFYPAEFIGINTELGYNKGAIVQGGIALRFNTLGN